MLDWGTLFHEEGRLEDALTQYRRALAVMRESGYRRFEGLALAYITSVEAALGRGAGAEAGYAEAGYAEAERILAAADDQLGLVAVRLLRAYLDVLAGRATAGDARIKAARPLAAHRTDVRFCVRIVDRALRPRAPEGLRIGPEGRWFEASDVGRGGRADLAGRDALRAILLCLAAAHAERPGEPVTSAELLARGWPGERVLPRAGANRVRVALSTLRKLGLRTSLIGRPDGWLLDPALPVARVQR
jgi:hypothetical protein